MGNLFNKLKEEIEMNILKESITEEDEKKIEKSLIFERPIASLLESLSMNGEN